jgi:hypothetical protein
VPRLEQVIEGARFEYAGMVVTALMFPVVLLVLRRMPQEAQPAPSRQPVRS